MPRTVTEAPALRPLRIGEILDVAIKIVWRNARTLIMAVLVVAVPLQLLGLAITLSTAPNHARPTFNDVQGGAPTVTADDGNSPAFWTGQVLVIILAGVVTVLATAACFKAIGDAYLGGRPPWEGAPADLPRPAPSPPWLTIPTVA